MGKLKKLKFGDIIVNHWSSEINPIKTGIFVKKREKTIILTDMKGSFWEVYNDHAAKLEIIGNVIDANQKIKK